MKFVYHHLSLQKVVFLLSAPLIKKSYNEKRSGVGGHLGVAGGEAFHGVGHLPRDAVAGIVRVLTRHVGVVDEAGKADNKCQQSPLQTMIKI